MKFVWLPALEAGWKALPINPDLVAYLLPGPDVPGKFPVTRVVFGQLIGAVAELRVKGSIETVAAALERGAVGDKAR